MLSVVSNIDYNILYSLLFKLPSKSIISLLFGELSNIDYFFTFLGIEPQPCPHLCRFHMAGGLKGKAILIQLLPGTFGSESIRKCLFE